MPVGTSTRRCGTSARSRLSECRTSAHGSVSSPRSRVESRSGSPSRRCCVAPMRCCFSTSRTTISTCPTKRWLEEQLRQTPKTVLLVSHDRELLARAVDPTRHARTGRSRGIRLGARRRFRHLPSGAQRPDGSSRRAAPAMGRAAREAAHPGREPQGQGLGERRIRLALPGGADPSAQVRGGRPAGRATSGPGLRHAPARSAHGQARRGRGEARAHRAHAAVRRRGLVRRPCRRARVERLGQVAFSCGCWREGAATPTRRSAMSPRQGSSSRRSSTPAAPCSALGWCQGCSRRRMRIRSSSAARCSRSCTRETSDGRGCRGMPRAPRSTATGWCVRRSRASNRCRVASRRASRCCCSNSRERRCCCSTSPPTISTSSLRRPWSRRWCASRARCWAVTHDRWFARSFDRFLVFGSDGEVYESDAPVWDERRVARAR